MQTSLWINHYVMTVHLYMWSGLRKQVLSPQITLVHMWLYLRKPSLMAQGMKSNLLMIIKPTLSHYLKIPSTAIDDQVCFHWRLIADPVKLPWCNTGSVGPVNGTNKDVTGVRLLPTTVFLSVTYWRHSTAVCVLMEGLTHLWLPTHPQI